MSLCLVYLNGFCSQLNFLLNYSVICRYVGPLSDCRSRRIFNPNSTDLIIAQSNYNHRVTDYKGNQSDSYEPDRGWQGVCG